MSNKRFFKWGMLVLALVFVLTIVGCKDDDGDDDYIYTWTFQNNSNYTVTVKCNDLIPSNFTISKGKTSYARSAKTVITILYGPSDKVKATTSDGKFTFSDK
jgi:hypothetical protein